MAIAPRLKDYLDRSGVDYEIVTHPRALSMMTAAKSAALSGECVAKSILLKDDGGYLLAVVPASHHVDLRELCHALNRDLVLAGEDNLPTLFGDCELGAIPPFGTPYELATVVDDSLAEASDLYFEAGDHCTLVHVSNADFRRLTADADHRKFSSIWLAESSSAPPSEAADQVTRGSSS